MQVFPVGVIFQKREEIILLFLLRHHFFDGLYFIFRPWHIIYILSQSLILCLVCSIFRNRPVYFNHKNFRLLTGQHFFDLRFYHRNRTARHGIIITGKSVFFPKNSWCNRCIGLTCTNRDHIQTVLWFHIEPLDSDPVCQTVHLQELRCDTQKQCKYQSKTTQFDNCSLLHRMYFHS